MPDLSDFRAFAELADRLIAEADKEDVAEAARILSLNVAHYRAKYGELPLENFADMLRAESIDEETAALLSDGMQNLLAALEEVLGLADDTDAEPMH